MRRAVCEVLIIGVLGGVLVGLSLLGLAWILQRPMIILLQWAVDKTL